MVRVNDSPFAEDKRFEKNLKHAGTEFSTASSHLLARLPDPMPIISGARIEFPPPFRVLGGVRLNATAGRRLN